MLDHDIWHTFVISKNFLVVIFKTDYSIHISRHTLNPPKTGMITLFLPGDHFFTNMVTQILQQYDTQRIEKGNELVLEKRFKTAIGYCPVTGKQAFDARIVMTFHQKYYRIKTIYPYYVKWG